MLHERLSMLMFSRMGIPCSREVHSTFYVNGEYIGVYLLVEYPDAAFLTRIFNESTATITISPRRLGGYPRRRLPF